MSKMIILYKALLFSTPNSPELGIRIRLIKIKLPVLYCKLHHVDYLCCESVNLDDGDMTSVVSPFLFSDHKDKGFCRTSNRPIGN